MINTFNLDSEIKKSLALSPFKNLVNFDDLIIDFSDLHSSKSNKFWEKYSPEYFIEGEIFFDELIIKYDFEQQHIRLFLPDISMLCQFLWFRHNDIYKFVIYHAIGRFICHTILLQNSNCKPDRLNKQGVLFNVFISQLIAYYLLPTNQKNRFIEFSSTCIDGYYMFHHFVCLPEFDPHYSNSINLPISDIIKFIYDSKNTLKKISQENISEYFDNFIRDRVTNCPSIVPDIFPILSKKQKNDFRIFLSK